MMNNVPGQRYMADANAGGGNQTSSQYALLTRMAELDVELAWSASAVGMAAHLLFAENADLNQSFPRQGNLPQES